MKTVENFISDNGLLLQIICCKYTMITSDYSFIYLLIRKDSVSVVSECLR